ncbi:MAG TPA: T9SS type A sorting domain-containing protein [Bacteroidia bacterium]|nr:T9SS type A sorting domain-containing protein [Bacteroidia bacterium]HNT80830.1 T9SS type A sorting domain-containing protein [Bacteroidia bacterium]
MRPLLILLLLSVFTRAEAQTATDFTVNDCDNNTHHLFDELDAGKVVVIAWTMPCGSCIGPILSAYNIAQTFAASNPGKILFYLTDDYGNSSCSIIESWAAQYNIGPNISSFSTSAINMNHYGGPGMPKVVVIAGGNHQVVFNENNTLNTANFQSAMTQALLLSDVKEPSLSDLISVYPVPTRDEVRLRYIGDQDLNVNVISNDGRLVKNLIIIASENGQEIALPTLDAGIYFLQMKSGRNQVFKRFVILN